MESRPAAKTGAVGRLANAPWFWPAVIFGLALALRIVYVLQARQSPFFETLGLDAKYYDRWARQLAAGEAKPEAFFMSPLYPYFLAGLYRLFGRDLLIVRVAQAVIGSLSAVLAYRIGVCAFDRRIGAVAGLATAGYGALIFYDGSILITPLLVFLGLLSLYLLLRADAERVPWLYAASGAAIGLAAVGKATALAFAPVALVWIVFDRGRTGGAGPDPASGSKRKPERRGASAERIRTGRGWLRPAALFVLGTALVVAPVTLRNYVVSRDLVFITSNGGLNFYIGNSEISTGGYVKPEGLDIIADPDGEAIAEAAEQRDLKPSEVSAYWYARAREYIADHPGQWLGLMARKLSFAVSAYELPQLENYYFQRRYSALLSMPLIGFAVVGPLGIVGLALACRRRRARLLALFTGSYLAAIAVFFVVARYRLPVVPVLVIGACYALAELWRFLSARRWLALFLALIAVAGLGVLVNANLYRVDRSKGFAQPHYRLGIIFGERGQTDRAIAEYRKAIEIDPDYVKSYANLGALLAMRGDHERAASVLNEAVRRDPTYSTARLNLALVHERAGDYATALSHIDTLLAVAPGDPGGLAERGVLLYRMGDTEGARKALEAARIADVDRAHAAQINFYLSLIERPTGVRIPQEARAFMDRADTLMQRGQVTDALAVLEEAAALAPESGEPLRRMALLRRDTGFLDEGIVMMRRALEIEPSLNHGHFTLAVFLNEAGRHDEAIREYEAELSMDPAFAPAHLNLSLTYRNHRANPNLAAFHYRKYRELGGRPIEALDEAYLSGAGAP